MDGWIEGALGWLEAHEGPLGYLVLGLVSLIEYVFPPFSGDTIALFGVFLAATAGWSPLAVYVTLNLGAMLGGAAAHAFGRSLRGRPLPRWLEGPSARRALRELDAQFEKRGAIILLANRFVPALRAFFFVAAGLADVSLARVLLWGGLSASMWNGLLLGLGWWLGSQWELLRSLIETYSAVVITLVAALALGLAVRAWRARAQR